MGLIPIGIGSDWISVNSKILYVRQKKKNYPQLESQIRVGPVLFSKRSIAQMRERERETYGPYGQRRCLKLSPFFIQVHQHEESTVKYAPILIQNSKQQEDLHFDLGKP